MSDTGSDMRLCKTSTSESLAGVEDEKTTEVREDWFAGGPGQRRSPEWLRHDWR
jgi:hypothetical protein